MKLNQKSVLWAINHIKKQSDTDIFPKQAEIKAICDNQDDIIAYLSSIDIGKYVWRDTRRFIIPKSENTYRIATQLNILDSIMFAAIIHQYGKQIEKARIPIERETVFSYRFKPKNSGFLYNEDVGWSQFWTKCLSMIQDYSLAVYLDISDFYNQIYHHTIEQQLTSCGISKEISGSIMELLSHVTSKSSRGIPIGPHSTHLLAELSLVPVDSSLLSHNIRFCRFCDDFIFFVDNEIDARISIYTFADILDKQQRLVLQQQKTKIMKKADFVIFCNDKLSNNPINDEEQRIVDLLRRRSNNPYALISMEKLTSVERELLTEEKLANIIRDALSSEDIDFTKLRWFFRRLAQIGTSNAINPILENYRKLLPAISDIMLYFLSVANSTKRKQPEIGEKLLALFDDRLISSNEYFQICLLNLFSSTASFNHIEKILALYDFSNSDIQREILLAAIPSKSEAWIREKKEKFVSMSPWCRRAFILATSVLPAEERKFFLNKIVSTQLSKIDNEDVLEKTLVKWSKARN